MCVGVCLGGGGHMCCCAQIEEERERAYGYASSLVVLVTIQGRESEDKGFWSYEPLLGVYAPGTNHARATFGISPDSLTLSVISTTLPEHDLPWGRYALSTSIKKTIWKETFPLPATILLT